MRFTTGQDLGDRAELGHDRLPNELDKSMMAASDCTEPVDVKYTEEGSMISNLPLLFANGYPTSLEKITLPQLERFITFMVQCSFGHDTAKVIGEPQWWPKEIKFTNPFVRPRKIDHENWMANLKKLVFRCYTYHRSEYLLRFCSHLAQHPHDKLEYVDNWDSTTSLYHRSTGKLLVTFRNENMNYDKKIESPRRLLLPRNGGGSVTTGKTKQQKKQLQAMMQPVLCDDIYLCDNCDAEFDGLTKMKEHEKLCCDQEQSSGSSRPVSPEVSGSPQVVQNQFLEYFGLSSNDTETMPKKSSAESQTNKTKTDGTRSSRRIRGSVNLARCPTIPFSSPAGIAMAKKSRAMTEVTQQERLDRIERYLIAPPLSNGSRPRWLDRVTDDNCRWIVTHKPNRDKPPPQDDYVHEYKFNSFRGKAMLSIRSQILCVACRKVIVPITMLTRQQIDELKKNPYKYDLLNRKKQIRRGPKPAPKSKRRLAGNHRVTLKRKNPGDVNFPIIIDVEESCTPTCVSASQSSGIEKVRNESETIGHPHLRSETETEANTSIPETGSQNRDTISGRLWIPPVIKVSKSPQDLKKNQSASDKKETVAVIDLCSSDDEDNSNSVKSTHTYDENLNPTNGDIKNVSSTILANYIQNKIKVSPRVYLTNSPNGWLKRIAEPCSGLFE